MKVRWQVTILPKVAEIDRIIDCEFGYDACEALDHPLSRIAPTAPLAPMTGSAKKPPTDCQAIRLGKSANGMPPTGDQLHRLHEFGKIGAGEGNRTLVFSLEGCCSTIELHPHRLTPNTLRWQPQPIQRRPFSGRRPCASANQGPSASLNIGRFATYVHYPINNERR